MQGIHKMKKILLPLMLCGCSLTALADPAYTIRATELKKKPFNDATTIMALSEKTVVATLQREGGWYQVQVNDSKGWIRMTALRLGDGTTKPGDSGLGSTLQFITTGRSGSSGVTAATGVRGLDAADISNAAPDFKAVDELEALTSELEGASAHAAQAKLKSSKIDYLPTPKSTGSKKSSNSSSPLPWE